MPEDIRSEYFYENPMMTRYKRSWRSDAELINRKKLTNKPTFISQAVKDILPTVPEKAEAFLNRIRIDKVHSMEVHNQQELIFYDILYFDGMENFCLYRKEYGTVCLLDKETEPPEHLTYDEPEI